MESTQLPCVVVFWFRRDLRLEDNAGLYHALRSGMPVLPVFIVDPKEIQHFQQPSDQRMEFIYRALSVVHSKLQQRGKGLLMLQGDPITCMQHLMEHYDVRAVYANEEYEPYAQKRDAHIAALLKAKGISLVLYKDGVIRAKDELLTGSQTPYQVFTAYKNAWRSTFTESDIEPWQSHAFIERCLPMAECALLPLEELGFLSMPSLTFTYRTDETLLREYADKRDMPALDATSHIGIHLRYGTVSIRRMVDIARCSDTWLDELLWREFFTMILYHVPRVEHTAYKPAYDAICWRNDEGEFARWCEGNTGYPLVDAGMRQLRATGWMHNRVRMVTASFLVKHLLIDWRWGEAYFASLLIDYDLALNNGNWQWVAGTGCDAAPYFRIFHPQRQQEKFDANGAYCRQWIDELHTPRYPVPMVEHRFARQRVLQAYQAAIKGDAHQD